MNEKVYVIKKTFFKGGKKTHVFVTSGEEILEMKHKNIADRFCEVMNENSDSGCFYTVIPIANNDE